MNQNMKIVGILTMLLIIGLPIVNALTGYGIRGNKNLNPDVLADGSSSGSSSSGSSSSGGDKYRKDVKGVETIGPTYRDGNKICQKFESIEVTTCMEGGKVDCKPGTATSSGVTCWEPAK